MQPLRPLTSVRFIFALLVVLFHGLTGHMQGWPDPVRAVIDHGSVGVSFFFILSGFILAYSYRGRIRGADDRRAFWLARAARVLPAYYLAFLLFLPLAIYGAASAPDVQAAFGRALVIAGLQLTLTQSWIPEAAVAWNGPAWSLSVEAVFYLLFPFLLPPLEKLSGRGLVIAALLAYAASQGAAVLIDALGPADVARVITGALGMSEQTLGGSALFFTYFPPLRVPEFVFGAALGLLFVRSPPMPAWAQMPAVAVGVAGVWATFSYLDGPVPWTAISNGFLAPALALILFGLARSQSQLWNHESFVRLGDASYSLYLLHIPIMEWMKAIDAATFNLQQGAFLNFFLIYLAVAILASLASLTFVEEPMRRLIRRKFAPELRAEQPQLVRAAG